MQDYKSDDKGLYLFLSIDIVGSTAFKNSHNSIGGDAHWMHFYASFYDEFSTLVNNEHLGIKHLKSLGDELIYYLKLNSSIELPQALETFSKAIRQYREQTAKLPINFKANAWLCGVPLINMMVYNAKTIIDFNGPQMDTGFRIAKFSSIEYFTISIDIVYILSVLKTKDKSKSTFIPDIYFLKKESLKGVKKGKPYSIYYINLADDEISLFNQSVKKKAENIDYDKTIDYLEKYFYTNNIDNMNFKPFIEGDKYIFNIPAKYQVQLDNLYKTDKNTEVGKDILDEATINNKLNLLTK